MTNPYLVEMACCTGIENRPLRSIQIKPAEDMAEYCADWAEQQITDHGHVRLTFLVSSTDDELQMEVYYAVRDRLIDNSSEKKHRVFNCAFSISDYVEMRGNG